MKDPIIAEIRKIRKDLDRMIENEPEKFRAEIKEIERQNKHRLVNWRARRIKTAA